VIVSVKLLGVLVLAGVIALAALFITPSSNPREETRRRRFHCSQMRENAEPGSLQTQSWPTSNVNWPGLKQQLEIERRIVPG